ncbi:hypothetical protein E6P18_09530 [Salmonella enterica]|nr:hypothetical protein [Salmonella enterica]EAV5408427.1 hypothetical protein [Salmonella enterica]EBX0640522.1 hypothetical protein [Salmonella enterica subsp. enterica serovar Johannesburg]
MNIKFSVNAQKIEVLPAYDRSSFCLEVDGVDVSKLIESISDNSTLLDEIGINEVCTWLKPRDAENVIDALGEEAVIEYLKNNGYEVMEKE